MMVRVVMAMVVIIVINVTCVCMTTHLIVRIERPVVMVDLGCIGSCN